MSNNMQPSSDEKQGCKGKLDLVRGWQQWLVKERSTQKHNACALKEWALELVGATPTLAVGGSCWVMPVWTQESQVLLLFYYFFKNFKTWSSWETLFSKNHKIIEVWENCSSVYGHVLLSDEENTQIWSLRQKPVLSIKVNYTAGQFPTHTVPPCFSQSPDY